MWEWTTETGKHDSTSSTTTYAVLRSGSFRYFGSNIPVCYRTGDNDSGNTSLDIGFRVVLYIK